MLPGLEYRMKNRRREVLWECSWDMREVGGRRLLRMERHEAVEAYRGGF